MRKAFFGCLGIAAVSVLLQFTPANVQAHGLFSPCDPACNPCDEVQCDPCDPCGSNGRVPTKAGGFFLNGHMEAGFFANSHGNVARYDGSGGGFIDGRSYVPNSGNTENLQNTRLTGAQVNQVYLSMGKAVDGRRGLDIGGTVDFTWGSDAYLVQAKGMEFGAGHGGQDTLGRWGSGDYFAAFSQAYVEVAYYRWNFIAGKFHAPFGSDSYKSTENFFYSWSLNNTLNPQVGGGAYASYKVSDKLTAIGGWVMPEELGESSKNNAFLGGLIWTPGKRLNVRYALAAGENTYVPYTGDKTKYFVHSLTATTQLSKQLKYVLDWSYNQGRSYLNGDFVDGSSAYAYGINNELIWQANKKWAFGTRFGMLHEGDCDEMYTVGVGANWTPNKWLIVKPEVRYDWTKRDAGSAWPPAFNEGTNTYQLSGGMSAVVKF